MKRRLIIRPEAEAELAEAFDWYERRVPGLGAEFLAAVAVVLDSVLNHPLQHPVVHSAVRRAINAAARRTGHVAQVTRKKGPARAFLLAFPAPLRHYQVFDGEALIRASISKKSVVGRPERASSISGSASISVALGEECGAVESP